MTIGARMADTHAGFRVGPRLRLKLDARRSDWSRGAQAKHDLKRYYRILERELERSGLSDVELGRLAEALTDDLDEAGDEALIRHLPALVSAVLGADDPLVEKVRALGPAGRLAVLDALERRVLGG